MFNAPKSPPWDRRISDLCRLGLSGPSKALIFRPYDIFSIDSFEPPHGEMTLSDLLKMFDKHVVHRSAAQCTNDRQSLCRELLRQHYSKARSHQRSEADENWSTSSTIPRSAIKRAASVTLFASRARTAK